MARVLMRNFDMDERMLSVRSGIPIGRVVSIIEGGESVDADIADKLRAVFGPVADRLLDMQKIHDFYLQEHRSPTLEERAAILGAQNDGHGSIYSA